MSHLLSLSELHAAAPGVLDVVFGADGEFLLAPMFRPPLWHADGHWVWQYQVDDLTVQPLALDLRTSAADRVAKLCAMSVLPERGFVVGACASRHRSGIWQLLWRDEHGYGKDACWIDDGKRCHPFDPDLSGAPFESPQHFLARLCVALAPRIRDLARRES